MGGNCQTDFLAKENIVRRDTKVSRRRGDIRPSKRVWKALERKLNPPIEPRLCCNMTKHIHRRPCSQKYLATYPDVDTDLDYGTDPGAPCMEVMYPVL